MSGLSDIMLPRSICIRILHYKATFKYCLFFSNRVVYSFEGPTIVYCRKRATTEEITRVLKRECGKE